jgi:hypothetical protein
LVVPGLIARELKISRMHVYRLLRGSA